MFSFPSFSFLWCKKYVYGCTRYQFDPGIYKQYRISNEIIDSRVTIVPDTDNRYSFFSSSDILKSIVFILIVCIKSYGLDYRTMVWASLWKSFWNTNMYKWSMKLHISMYMFVLSLKCANAKRNGLVTNAYFLQNKTKKDNNFSSKHKKSLVKSSLQ